MSFMGCTSTPLKIRGHANNSELETLQNKNQAKFSKGLGLKWPIFGLTY